MLTSQNLAKRKAETLGTWMFIVGALIIGPIGFILLSLIAYSMYFSNVTLGVLCTLILGSPLALMGFWVSGLGAQRLEENVEDITAPSSYLGADPKAIV